MTSKVESSYLCILHKVLFGNFCFMDATAYFIGFQRNGSISYKPNLVTELLASSVFFLISFRLFLFSVIIIQLYNRNHSLKQLGKYLSQLLVSSLFPPQIFGTYNLPSLQIALRRTSYKFSSPSLEHTQQGMLIDIPRSTASENCDSCTMRHPACLLGLPTGSFIQMIGCS